MGVACLFMLLLTAGFGLFLATIWLIEYDKDFQAAAATRLPPVVLTSHALAAVGGLTLWIAYLIWDSRKLAWYSVVALVLAATLGLFMAIRWIGVYRTKRASERLAPTTLAAPVMAGNRSPRPEAVGPPERDFPLPAVIIHGIFAVTTLTLVLLTAFG